MSSKKTIDAVLLKKMFLSAAKSLDSKKEWINDLNVFPVPDGDTGTNMTMTIMSAVSEVNKIADSDLNMESLCKAISTGSLRGARGNSGVILSQLLRGFTRVVKHNEEIDLQTLVKSLESATETAYKAVMKPKEGTVLTVARGISEKAVELQSSGVTDMGVFLEKVLSHGKKVLAHTPDLLPVLKEAGVVDSGGQGLIVAMEGAFDCYLGKEIDLTFGVASGDFKEGAAPMPSMAEISAVNESLSRKKGKDSISTADIKFGYCTEFIIQLNHPFTDEEEDSIKEYLLSIGDSLVCVSDDELCKIHVHTNHPGSAFEKGLEFGSLIRMKVDNMREEHSDVVERDEAARNMTAEDLRREVKGSVEGAQVNPLTKEVSAPGKKKDEPRKPYGFISVVAGSGLENIFKELGADRIISGGQTMNPSTDDMLSAVEEINADTIFILPNNKNIIMAANQARDLTEDKKVIVIPSKTVPQGITAIINFSPDASAEENEAAMVDSMKGVKSGSITYAVRDTSIDGQEIHKDDIMGIGDKGLLAVGQEISQTTVDTIESLIDDSSELISIYYGNGVEPDDAGKISELLGKKYPMMDVVLQEGSQPVYYYIVSVE